MMTKLLLVLIGLALAACAAGEPLPPIEGAWYALNSGRWQPSEAELQQIKAMPEK